MVWVFLDVQVGDDNGVHTLSAKIGDHFFERGEVLAIDGEGRIALLVINVEIDDVRWNSLFAKSSDNLADAGLGIIAVAALLVAERPQWRQGCVSSQGGVFFHDFSWLGAGHEVIVQLAAFGAKGEVVASQLAKIERASIRIVEENAVSDAFAQSDQERDGLVERVGGFLPAKFVGVPAGEGAVAAVHGPGLVTQGVVIFIDRHFLPDMHLRTVPGHGQARLIGEQHISGEVRKGDKQGRFGDQHIDGAGSHLYFILSIVDPDRAAYGVQRRLGHGPREILWKVSVGRDAHTHNAVGNLGNSNLGLAGRQLGAVMDALLKYLDALYFADVVPALSKPAGASHSAEQQPRSQASNQLSHVHPPDGFEGLQMAFCPGVAEKPATLARG